MRLIEDFKKDINNSLKEIQENISKQVEALREETHYTSHNDSGKLQLHTLSNGQIMETESKQRHSETDKL